MRRRHNADKKATDKEQEKEIDQDEHSSDVEDSSLEDSDAKLGIYSHFNTKNHLAQYNPPNWVLIVFSAFSRDIHYLIYYYFFYLSFKCKLRIH